MRHFDTWVLRDPYSIWHYYPTGHRWRDTVRDLIHSRAICSPETSGSYPSPPINSDIHSQSQSTLLCLPAELRQMIWSYVLTNDSSPSTSTPQTLHLVQLKGKIRHVRCPTHSNSPITPSETEKSQPNPALTQNRHCCPTTPARWRIYDGRVPGHSDRLLYPHTHEHLPTTLSNSNVCRRIFTEAEHILYQASRFDVDDLYTFVAFSESISPTARNSIQRLTVQWMPIWIPMEGLDHKGSIYGHTHSDELWVRFWGSVGGLKGLKELGLSLDLGRFTGFIGGGGEAVVSGQRIPFGMGEGWVRPLLGVRGLKCFDLAVTARCDLVARGVVESELIKEVGELRDGLRWFLYRPKEDVKECSRKREGRERLAITAG
ncbi:unnamed protein product [Penicillium bialowiezense]